ncbi:MAG TPA: hypothetical protein VF109_00400, partial [Mycobacteriales bacterium]
MTAAGAPVAAAPASAARRARVGAPSSAGVPERVGRLLPVLPALEPLVGPGGLRRGSSVGVRDSTSLLLALLAGPSRAGAWCAVAGMPALGLVAAAGAGVDLDRLALVPEPGPDWSAVAAALLDAMDVVVVAPPTRPGDGEVRRLSARARQRGAVLVPFGAVEWPGLDLRLSVTPGARWEGLGDGHGHLRARRAVVRGEGRGSAARVREAGIWLPSAEGEVVPAGWPAAAAGGPALAAGGPALAADGPALAADGPALAAD